MREILFRGKRTDNGEWVEGYLTRRPSAIQYEAHYSPWFIDKPPSDPDDSGGFYNVDRETVGQFTGLTDRNGKRIFEGDIIRTKEFTFTGTQYNDHNYEVVFKNGCFMLSKNNRITHGVAVWHGIGEVIGNIYDNPELLNEIDEREGRE